jgi:diguanylate cyclase (GGDEF)-like protein
MEREEIKNIKLENLSQEELVKRLLVLERENEFLRRENVTDFLTGVFNERGFFKEAERQHRIAEREGKPYAVFFIDIDKFKKFNDRYGHRTGNTVLQIVAEASIESIRNTDIFGRIGGDEFAGILIDYTEEGFKKIRERVLENINTKLEEKLKKRTSGLMVTLSIGFREWRGERSFKDVLDAADKEMYSIKNG